jgi:CBS domain-containing protein
MVTAKAFAEQEVTKELDTLASLARKPFVLVAPDTPIADVRRHFIERRVPAILVVDYADNLIGIVTRTDVLRSHGDACARDVMSAAVFVLPLFASVERACALMAYEGVNQIVVTDGAALVGVVSALDLVRHYAVEAGYLVAD